jgi:hypothetical protein
MLTSRPNKPDEKRNERIELASAVVLLGLIGAAAVCLWPKAISENSTQSFAASIEGDAYLSPPIKCRSMAKGHAGTSV